MLVTHALECIEGGQLADRMVLPDTDAEELSALPGCSEVFGEELRDVGVGGGYVEVEGAEHVGVDNGADGLAAGWVAVQKVQHEVCHRLGQLLREEAGVRLPWEWQVPAREAHTHEHRSGMNNQHRDTKCCKFGGCCTLLATHAPILAQGTFAVLSAVPEANLTWGVSTTGCYS